MAQVGRKKRKNSGELKKRIWNLVTWGDRSGGANAKGQEEGGGMVDRSSYSPRGRLPSSWKNMREPN